MTDEYQGFSNWETWAVSLHLSNDQPIYLETIEILSRDFEYNHKRYEALEEFVFDLLDRRIIDEKISIHRVDFKEVAWGFSETSDKIIKACDESHS